MKRLIATAMLIAPVALIHQSALADVIHVPDDYPTIQEAIDASADGDEINVAPGRYPEPIDLRGREIYLHSSHGAESTTIDVSRLRRVGINCDSNETARTIIEGFRVNGGRGEPRFDNYGGGLRIAGCSPTVRECVFTNSLAASGAGAYLENSNALIVSCDFIDNEANDSFGGGMWIAAGKVAIVGCAFIGNSVDNLDLWEASGGAIHNGASDSSIYNCLFAHNYARDGGGAIRNDYSSNTTIAGCTFVDNRTNLYWSIGGGAISNSDASSLLVAGSILFGNRSSDGDQIYNDPGCASRIVASNIENSGGSGTKWDASLGIDVGGNIDTNPMFMDPSQDDYRLRPGSSCIDAGINRSIPKVISTDLAGNPRFVDSPWITDTGSGNSPVADMGCYENQAMLGPRLDVIPKPLRSGERALFILSYARNRETAMLFYSLSGKGKTVLPPLNVTLDLRKPWPVDWPQRSDIEGSAEWIIDVPRQAAGLDIWFQVAQKNVKTSVAETHIN